VLADGWTYAQWVVGSSRMRSVDDDWPAPGSAVRHSVGVWPVVINDQTLVERRTPLEELVLLAKLGRFGAAWIKLGLRDAADGCCVEMSEVPAAGTISMIPDRVALAALTPRNRECLWRLSLLAERRNSNVVR
jgi:hypothetical protein